MFAEFEVYGRALGLASCCLYGGAPYQSQHNQLKRGVDIVVGTPGRIKVYFAELKFVPSILQIKLINCLL